ncbi:MAG: hypothetical protein WC532_04095 [Candidatus Omnitrophota bacterium]
MKDKRLVLVAASFLALFLELSLIRWLPAHVFSLAFFSNIVLIAAFLGLGLGFMAANLRQELFDYFIFILACFVCLALALRDLRIEIPFNNQTWLWSYVTGNKGQASLLKVSISQAIAIIFAAAALVFIPVGQKICRLMKEFKPLPAYSWNIFGSLLGIVIFAALSVFSAPAYLWFAIIGAIAVLVMNKKRFLISSVLVIAAVAIVLKFVEKDTLWSPYYAIRTIVSPYNDVAVYVNRMPHQVAVNFEKNKELYEKYLLAYQWFKPKKILIMGSGTGNDVFAAWQAGAEHIDAVEIDPVILRLGRQMHPQRPYESDKVHAVVDDGRSFMRRPGSKYDMVVYGTLDSHAVLSATSSVRLDNYVYTQEALQQAGNILEADGVLVMLFSVPTEWMRTRLLESVRAVFGTESTRYLSLDRQLFNLMIVAGPGLKRALLGKKDFCNRLLLLPEKPAKIEAPKDDWPYLYLASRGIPRLYVVTLAGLIIFSAAAIFLLLPKKTKRLDPVFFLLGSGFLLLETKSVTTFSLLFGSTWLVNAVLFSVIMIIILLANKFVMARHSADPKFFLTAAILSLTTIYFFPLQPLLGATFFVKVLAVCLLLGVPIFFSSAAFAILFSRTKDSGVSLGSNLLGAVIGGFLEYSSMLWGLNALYLVAIACYAAALFYLLKNRGVVGNEA